MKRLTRQQFRLLGAALAAVLLIGGATAGFLLLQPDASTDEQPVKAPQRVSHVNGETRITLGAAAQRQAGIITQQLATGSWGASLRAYGIVLDPQPLSELANRYVSARAQLQSALARADGAQLAAERARTLYADQQNMSAAQLQAAEASYRTERASVAASQSDLATLAASAQQSWGPVLGESLLKGTLLATRIAARQQLLVQVTLWPGETAAAQPTDAWVQLDDGMRVTLNYVSPATHTDPHIQGASLLFTAPAAAGLLPGMSVVVRLPGTGTLTGALLPPSAVIWTEGGAWAYFKSGPGVFVRRRVPSESALPEGYLVNLPQGTEAVVQGAQMLLSEEQRALLRVTD